MFHVSARPLTALQVFFIGLGICSMWFKYTDFHLHSLLSGTEVVKAFNQLLSPFNVAPLKVGLTYMV